MSFIDPKEAKTMISRYRLIRPTIPNGGVEINQLTLSETFSKAEVQDLLDQNGCKGFRVYFSMDTENAIRLVMVGTDENGEDLLPEDAFIIERGDREPPNVTPPSPINS